MQVLNLAYGGTIEQHLPDAVGHEEHKHTPGTFADHEVRLEPGSLAARAAGTELTAGKSHHHQGVREGGEGLRDRKSTRLNSSHANISYAVFCLKKKT